MSIANAKSEYKDQGLKAVQDRRLARLFGFNYHEVMSNNPLKVLIPLAFTMLTSKFRKRSAQPR